MIGYVLFVALVLGGAYGVYFFWRRRVDAEIEEGARVEYDLISRGDPALLQGLDLPRFTEIYARVNTPRFPAYQLFMLTIFLLGTPIILTLLYAFSVIGVTTGIIPQSKSLATELQLGADGAALVNRVSQDALAYILQGWSGFYYFFGLAAFWLTLAYFTLRRYHLRAPGSLREEILRAR